MRVIDLLQRIANGEEVPEKIQVYSDIFILDYGNMVYEHEKTRTNLLSIYNGNILNYEVEIIEEDKKDEEIEIYVNGKEVDITDIYEPLKQGEYIYKENGKWYVHKLKNVSFVIEEDKKIENIDLSEWAEITYQEDWEMLTKDFNRNCNLFVNKINEIIDYIKMEDK